MQFIDAGKFHKCLSDFLLGSRLKYKYQHWFIMSGTQLKKHSVHQTRFTCNIGLIKSLHSHIRQDAQHLPQTISNSLITSECENAPVSMIKLTTKTFHWTRILKQQFRKSAKNLPHFAGLQRNDEVVWLCPSVCVIGEAPSVETEGNDTVHCMTQMMRSSPESAGTNTILSFLLIHFVHWYFHLISVTFTC